MGDGAFADNLPQHLQELQVGLDAHAIVAATDGRGIITYVNDRFCSISGYSREELLGQNHRIINSGQHPPTFFREMWRTIASGRTWKGEICNRAKNGSLYWVQTTIVPFMDGRGRPCRYVAVRSNVTERKQLELRMRQMAYEDVLTGLPNRRSFYDRLETRLNPGCPGGPTAALMLLDLNDFKGVNDSFGHQCGDKLLRIVAARLRACVAGAGDVCRLGGDEFAILVLDLGGEAESASSRAVALAETILAALREPCQIDGWDISRTCSIGLILFRGHGGGSGDGVDDLLRKADFALYQAKGGGGNRACLFDRKQASVYAAQADMQVDVRRAMERKQFLLYHQSIVDQRRRVVGVEGLLRLWRAEGDVVSPDGFIPLAERSGHIVRIGEWVLEQACRELSAWNRTGTRRGLFMAVNISPTHFRNERFTAQVLELIAGFGIRSGQLKIEITEGALLSDLDEAIAKMQVLKRNGVRVAIDDFGTGYSSLGYLKRLPVDFIKLDRSFVRDVATSAVDGKIVSAVLGMAHGLGLKLVAEGVETEKQFAWLTRAGCRYFQGYLFSRPTLDLHAVLEKRDETRPARRRGRVAATGAASGQSSRLAPPAFAACLPLVR